MILPTGIAPLAFNNNSVGQLSLVVVVLMVEELPKAKLPSDVSDAILENSLKRLEDSLEQQLGEIDDLNVEWWKLQDATRANRETFDGKMKKYIKDYASWRELEAVRARHKRQRLELLKGDEI